MHCLSAFVLASLSLVPAYAANPFAGRWDLTIKTPKDTYPGWMQVTGESADLQVRVQPRSGSAFNVTGAKLDGGRLIVPMDKDGNTVLEFTALMEFTQNALAGTMRRKGDNAGTITAVPAPTLNHKPPQRWSKPEPLFNGHDLTGWEPDKPQLNHWVAKDGALVNETKGANLRTTRKFNDFKLHVELNCPENGNSGIYLRGRYEMQVEYEPAGTEDAFHTMGAIYGAVATKGTVARTPGQWETFDITFVGRTVTIVRNGVTIIDNQEIAGITGGALDSNEGEPGVFYIQGDHTGGILFRNITISEPGK
ncbi:MAG: DUF1080 domain-containing protein [Bryobacteraceae bacterium]